jgi:tubulin gamma
LALLSLCVLSVGWTNGVQVALSRKSPYVKTAHKVSGLMMANHTSIATVRVRPRFAWIPTLFVVLLACVAIPMRELLSGRCASRVSPSRHPQLFERTIRQFSILYAKKAYISNFQTQPMFKDGLEEFDDALYVVGAVNSSFACMPRLLKA